MQHLLAWYEQNLNGLGDAVNRLDLASGEQAAEAGRAALASSALSPSEKGALALVIDYLIGGLRVHSAPPSVAPDLFEKLYEDFSQPQQDEMVEQERKQRQLQLHIVGLSNGYIDPDPARVRSLISGIPIEARNAELWHYLAYWACREGDLSLLDQAYEEMAISQNIGHYGYLWHRVRILHRLGHGTALLEDAQALLMQASAPVLRLDFEKRILPLLERAGMETGDLLRSGSVDQGLAGAESTQAT